MDDIQRKLDLIDRQLAAGPGYYHRQIISTAPLLFCATGLIGGIVIQNAAALPVWVWLVMLGFCATAAVLIFAVHKEGKIASYAPVLLSTCALICFLCLGAIRLAGFYQAKPNDIRNLIADDAKLATIRGLIITEPYIQQNQDWKFARFQFTDPACSFYLKVSEVETVDGWAKATGTVRVQVDEPVLDLKAGDYVQMYCRLDRFRQPTNPGQFNTAEYLARKGVFVAAS
ncbi:MAG: ComEC/Rec2 family competence protein, partial [Planctomycetota bacterium]|nr:ComEC/Rec2 family competence protein [Planctomycetota bacterium]